MRLLILYGTRPEAIKLAPLILEAKKRPGIDLFIVNTGQHREMTREVEEVFKMAPDFNLDIMKPDQSLNHIISNITGRLDKLLVDIKPDIVLVQGDTSTVLATSICCFNLKIPLGHVEAGLRSNDLNSPFPEEYNRKIVSISATFNFAPTSGAQRNLISEGIPEEKIFITGNTVVDAAEIVKSTIEQSFKNNNHEKKRILVTAHRRENHEKGIDQIIKAAKEVILHRPDIEIVWPVHPNPNVKDKVYQALSGIDNIRLLPPISYKQLVLELMNCYLIWTDSGGIQEEATSFGKPVLILRDTTERPEVITSGFGILTYAQTKSIIDHTFNLLDNEEAYLKMISNKNPFGDGTAAVKILNIILKKWNESTGSFSE